MLVRARLWGGVGPKATASQAKGATSVKLPELTAISAWLQYYVGPVCCSATCMPARRSAQVIARCEARALPVVRHIASVAETPLTIMNVGPSAAEAIKKPSAAQADRRKASVLRMLTCHVAHPASFRVLPSRHSDMPCRLTDAISALQVRCVMRPRIQRLRSPRTTKPNLQV